jgi:two-component system chemotaxis sensor kinase CheA
MAPQVSREDIEEFVKEGRDYFINAEPILIKMSSGEVENSEDSMGYLFRVFHSIKGVAGFLSLNNIQTTSHKIENLLDLVRSGKATMSEQMLHHILNACDLIKRLIEFTDANNNDNGYQEEVDQIVLELIDYYNSLSGTNIQEIEFAGATEGGRFACFANSAFLSSFQNEFENLISQLEMSLFELLDSPQKSESVIKETLEKIQTMEFNLSLVQNSKGLAIFKELKAIAKSPNSAKLFGPDGLGTLFKICEFLKVNIFSYNADDQEDEKSICEELTHFLPIQKIEEHHAEAEPNSAPKAITPKSITTTKPDDMRVEIDKIDKLIELIEELGVVTGVVTRDPESEVFNIYIFQQAANKLKQITEALQDVAMSVRLVPLSITFNKMQRLCFDVSQKLGKKVKLLTTGENTEIDKNMVEAIQDPLVHIFRNAIDHGLETIEERIEAGKSEVGQVELRAWHGGGEVFISIRDDGKGMDPARILAKAKEKGIVDANENSLSQKQILNLIFEPGFSTAAAVTDFSGRGVGMDVVKKAIEKLNGQIEIFSEFGTGSTFLLSFPLTSTIVEGMLVKVGNFTYTIRIASVRESIKVNASQIILTPDGKESIKVRTHVYPVIRLSSLNKSRNFKTEIHEGILVLVENKGNIAALLVDEILGTNHNVIKALPSYFNKLKGVAGCSVIGTGTADISWTVDINSLMTSED